MVACICFSFFGITCIAQDVCIINKLDQAGLLLNGCWKYQQGDSAQWALPIYDDSKWQLIDPTKDINTLTALQPGSIGWFRFRFKLNNIDDSQLGMIMQSSGASEIYLDGKRIHSFGQISNDPHKIKAYDPLFKPVPLFVAGNADHVLAVRYVLQPGIQYTTIYETVNPAILIRLHTLQNSINHYGFFTSSIVGMHLCIIGTCLLLFILHLAFYIFNPAQKANLSFSIFALGFILFNILQYYFFLHGHQVSSKFLLGNISMAIRMASNLFLLTAVYSLLDHKRDRFYWTLMIFSVIALFLNFLLYDVGWRIGGALMELVIGVGIARIAYKAQQSGKRGAWILLGGSIGYFIFFTAFLSFIFFPNQEFLLNLSILRIVLYILSFLSIPLATSIFLGLEFAFTNRTLSDKIREIEDLSAKSIRQEREKQEILEAQKETLEIQVKERTNALSKSIDDLRSTQEQLIQSEKMASLGELTAGIAHEIQNPLNFVNNFSETNIELIEEMEQELAKGNLSEAQAIANDVKENEEKIVHHGKRADAIVKNMLQHSRANSGIKEPTDINALVDECLRLSYHMLRAKDKSFNAKLETQLDFSIDKVNAVPQDISRVFINLFNNALYSVTEKKKQLNGAFEPKLSVSTKQINGQVEVHVNDNGTGIPKNHIDKIYQPFFTTKPTGEGTGLGLSMSYDIIKAHGGELRVQSKDGEGAEFIIQLPNS